MKLTEIAIRRPAFMTMIFSALAIIGIFSYTQMGVDLLPKMDWPMVFVTTTYPGAGPKEIETQVSKPIEEALSSLNGLKNVRTYSSENVSFAWVEFNMSADVNVALNDVERKINEMRSTLPTGCKQPEISKADINSMPILRVSVTSSLDEQKAYQFIKDNVKNKLEQIPGVAGVSIVGGRQREIKIEIDNDKLKSYNLSITQVTQLINSENLDFPTGKIQKPDDKNYIVRVAGKFTDLETMKKLVIAYTPNGKIALSDIAKVSDSYTDDYTMSRLQDVPSVGLIIQKASDANSIKASDMARKAMKELETLYAQYNLKFTVAQDITNFTRDSINDVVRDLGLSIILVAITLFLFLHNFKNSLIVLLSIPTSLLSSFIMMYIFGFTVNIITMLALTLVIGVLVDDSIVVLENIHRHLEMGEDSVNASINGRNEIGMAAIAITLVDVVVFLPIAMLSGIVGKIFREFGLTIVVSTMFSLFVSFTLTPLLASRWSKLVHFTKETLLSRFIKKFENGLERLSAAYSKVLEWALNHRKTILGLSFALLLTSLTYVPLGLIGSEFFPQTDRGEFAINMEMPLGTSVEKTDEATRKVEDIVRKAPEIEQFYTVVGRKEVSFGQAERSYYSQIQIKLKPKNQREETQTIITQMLSQINRTIPGIEAQASLIGMFGASEDAPIAIEVKGQDLEKLVEISDKVDKVVGTVKGTRDVKSSWLEGQPEIKVVVDREKCMANGLSLGEVAMTLRNALEGDNTTKFKENDTEYDIRIMLDKNNRDNPEDVANITILNKSNQQVKLQDVATVYFGKGPSEISRKNRSRVITISSNMDNTRPLSDIMADIKKNISSLNIPKDVEINYAGSSEDMENMFSDMMLAILFAIIFVYMIMVSLYESFVHPFTIMFSLPVALFGALTGLLIFGENINMFSLIGVIMSMGLVTKNAILLVDYTNTLRKEGYSMREALLKAGPIRLRPIIMTTVTMILGMMPLAIGSGSGGEFRSGLAIVVIGALTSSTALTLVLVPVIYTYMEGFIQRFSKKSKDKPEISAI
jgi:HAE1 family hydrophobic/amphiphilic exporter-1